MIRVTLGNNISRNTVIIDENTTLRAAFEEAGVDYSVGMSSLDGSTLGPGDLDKTFADFGVTEKCYLLNIVKADNAAAVKIVGGACVIESSATLEEIKTLQKFRPGVLSLYNEKDGKKEPVFTVGLGKGTGSINSVGVSFGSAVSSDGKATVTLMVPEDAKNAKEWAEDRIGVSILHLNKVERGFEAALEEVKTEKTAVSEAIKVL